MSNRQIFKFLALVVWVVIIFVLVIAFGEPVDETPTPTTNSWGTTDPVVVPAP